MTRRSAAAHYPIRAVSKLTGIAIDTLRAWERRHGAVTPVRDDRGRMYTDADVARLRLLRTAVDHGHSIGRLAGLSDEDLRRVTATAREQVPGVGTRPPSPLDPAALDAAVRNYDAAAIDRELARLAASLPPLDFVRDVLMPVLARIGNDWHKGRIAIAHEHLTSATIRNILGSFLRLHVRADAPVRLLFATLSGDRHEMGTLGAAMIAASHGLGVAYLGPDLPAREIIDSVRPARARVVVLGMTTTMAAKTRERELQTLVRNLPRDVELWAGGRGTARHAALIGERGLVLADYDAYERELTRVRGGHG